MRNKQGKFYISDVLVFEHPEIVQMVMSKVIVVRCEYLYHKLQFEYYAIGDVFDEVQEGCRVPLYDVSYSPDGVGFHRVE